MTPYLRIVRAIEVKKALKTWAAEGYLCQPTAKPQQPFADGQAAVQYSLTPIFGATKGEPSRFDD